MSLFHRKTVLPSDFFQGVTDVHCHLLPGVDDGFPNEEASFKGLAYMESLGFRRIMLTPHVMLEYPDNTASYLRQRFAIFKEKAAEHTSVELRLAAEYMLDERFISHKGEGWLYLSSATSTLLVETSYLYKGHNMEQNLYDLMTEDQRVVIAHPERYAYAKRSDYVRWKDSSYLFQLNLMSLAGAYGGLARENALHLLESGMYDLVGSDLHKTETFRIFLPQMKLTPYQIDLLRSLYENNAKLVDGLL